MTPDDHIDEDGGEPIEMLERYCEAHGWPHELIGDDEIVTQVQGSWTSYELRGVWRPEDNVLQILLFPEIKIVEETRAISVAPRSEPIGPLIDSEEENAHRAFIGKMGDKAFWLKYLQP